ncbi:hypothetical protein FGB62_446g00 [Gracilaria domingensis]|nr:hypothetical protein FGB62_446g00 [Gracilaria domingensis]
MLMRPQSLGISRLPKLSDVGQNGLSFLTQRRGIYPRRLGVSTTSHDASSEEGEEDSGSRRESLTATARHGSCVTQTTGHIKKDSSGWEVTLVSESSPIPDSEAFPEPSIKESTALAYDVARNRDSASASMPRSEVLLAVADSLKKASLAHENLPVSQSLSDTKSLELHYGRHVALSTALLESQKMALACLSEPRTSETQHRTDRDDFPTAESTGDTAPCGKVDTHNVIGFLDEIRSRDRRPSISVSPDSLVADAPVFPTNAGLVLNAPDGDTNHRFARNVGTQTLMKSELQATSGAVMPRCWESPAQPLHEPSLEGADCTTAWRSLDHQMEVARDCTELGPRMAPISTHGGQLQRAKCTVAQPTPSCSAPSRRENVLNLAERDTDDHHGDSMASPSRVIHARDNSPPGEPLEITSFATPHRGKLHAQPSNHPATGFNPFSGTQHAIAERDLQDEVHIVEHSYDVDGYMQHRVRWHGVGPEHDSVRPKWHLPRSIVVQYHCETGTATPETITDALLG